MSEQVCQRCRRVCFSQQQLENHACFDMAAKIEGEIRLAATAPANIPFQNWLEEYHRKQGVAVTKDSCGSGASEGKAGDAARVEGLGAGTVVADNSAKTAVNHAQSSRSESHQNCDGLGAGWGTQPAGIPFMVEDMYSTKEVTHEAATVAALDTKEGAAQSASAPSIDALILAQSYILLSRSFAYIALADLHCGRDLAVEIRDHQDAIQGYALSRGIGAELAEALLSLTGATGASA